LFVSLAGDGAEAIFQLVGHLIDGGGQARILLGRRDIDSLPQVAAGESFGALFERQQRTADAARRRGPGAAGQHGDRHARGNDLHADLGDSGLDSAGGRRGPHDARRHAATANRHGQRDRPLLQRKVMLRTDPRDAGQGGLELRPVGMTAQLFGRLLRVAQHLARRQDERDAVTGQAAKVLAHTLQVGRLVAAQTRGHLFAKQQSLGLQLALDAGQAIALQSGARDVADRRQAKSKQQNLGAAQSSQQPASSQLATP
jgi:hypothetical protein